MSGIASVACYLTSLIALVAAVSKIRQARVVRSASGRYLGGAILASGLATALFAPVTLSVAIGIEPVPNLARLASNALAMVGPFCLLAMMIHSSRPLECRSRRIRRHALLLMVCVVAMVSFLVAGETGSTIAYSGTYASNPWIIAHTAVRTGYIGLSLVVFMWLASREMRRPEMRRLVRAGLQVTLVAAGVGLVGVLWVIASLVNGGGTATNHEEISALLMAVGIAVLAAGSTLTAWAPWVLGWTGRLRARRALRMLRPLWARLAEVRPLMTPSLTRVSDLGSDNAISALHRRVVAIRDVQLALRPFVHPELRTWAADAARQHGLNRGTAAIITEAAELGAALDAYSRDPFGASPVTHGAPWMDRRRNARRASDPLPPPEATPDVLAEARLLAHVGLALRASSIVGELRRRARAHGGVSPSSPP